MARTLVNAAVVLVAFVGGLVAWAVIGGDAPASDDGDAAVAANDPEAFTVPFGGATTPPIDSHPPAPPTDGGAPSPTEAVAGFLRAEVDGSFDDSYLLLSSADRTTYPSAARWESAHRSLPVITGFEIASSPAAAAAADADRVEVGARLELEPALDEVVGLVPAGADARWVAVREGDVWRISLADSVLNARWPSDSEAPDAVRRWADSVQECRPDEPTAAEWDGGLLGTPAAADGLCGADGRIRVGDATRLDPIDATPFVTAFGEDVASLARVVPVLSPAELLAVVAPLSDDWLVVGTLPPPP
jgi:hypothetical protein